jgi:hypothetical protein
LKTDFLIVICETKNLTEIAETIVENFEVWRDRQWGDLDIMFLKGDSQKIKRVGCTLIGLRNSFPSLRIEIIDAKGII